VNFYGHAVVATWDADDADFVLGSMMPDLLAMVSLGEGMLQAPSPRLAAGLAHHHRVDGLFHAAAPFRSLLLAETRRLREAGVARGAATAAAHVAIELVLDGTLAADPRGRGAYRSALARAADARALRWQAPGAAATWAMLVEKMRGGDVPDGYRDPGFVCRRVTGVLARRPRLALSAAEQELLARSLPAVCAAVESQGPRLLDALRAPRGDAQ
jgi:hypothetical protein